MEPESSTSSDRSNREATHDAPFSQHDLETCGGGNADRRARGGDHGIASSAGAAVPAITGFTPGSGPVGTHVTITGTDLSGATSVRFNGTTTPFTVNGMGTQAQANVPLGATDGPISITTPGGVAVSSPFDVTGSGSGSAPTITSYDPTSGNVGTLVNLHGTNFTGVTGVAFHGTNAAFTFVSDVKVTALVPSGATTGKISLTTPAGTAMTNNSFTVTSSGPTITNFNPVRGNVGTVVTIHGTNFGGVTSVKFNGTSASFAFVSTTKITAVVPNGATTGKISVTTPSGTATSAGVFIVSGPKITGFNPGTGNPGTRVTINGSNFSGLTSVKFNGTPATFSLVNSGKITAFVPSGATSGPISVTTPMGTATSSGTFTVLAEHGRSVSLQLVGGRHRVTGQVGVNDGFSQCQQSVPVVIKRFHFGQWRWVATVSTGQLGNFRALLPNRSGAYRARAVKIKLANGAVCKGDLSNVVHYHR